MKRLYKFAKEEFNAVKLIKEFYENIGGDDKYMIITNWLGEGAGWEEDKYIHPNSYFKHELEKNFINDVKDCESETFSEALNNDELPDIKSLLDCQEQLDNGLKTIFYCAWGNDADESDFLFGEGYIDESRFYNFVKNKFPNEEISMEDFSIDNIAAAVESFPEYKKVIADAKKEYKNLYSKLDKMYDDFLYEQFGKRYNVFFEFISK